MKDYFKIAWCRFKSTTPPFFKKAQAFGATLAAAGTGLTQATAIPEKIPTVLITAGTVMVVVGQFACENLKPKTESNGAVS